MTNNFYPALSTVISSDQIPDSLNFIADSIDDLLDQVYFKDLKLEKSNDASTYSCLLDIVSNSGSLELTIPGTGLILQLNPDSNNPEDDTTIIPILLNFKWGILKLLKKFNISNFSFEADAFNKLILQVTQINDSTLTSSAIDAFINSTDPVSQFINDVNQSYPELAIPTPPDPDYNTAIGDILNVFQQHPDISLYDVLFQLYVLDNTSLPNSLSNLDQLYFPFLGLALTDNFKDLFVPSISASVQLSAGLQIPRSLLIPVKPNGEIEQDTTINTELLFGIGTLSYDSTSGFGFKDNVSVTFPPAYPTAQIGTTGIIIGFTNAVFYTTPASNNAAIDAAGYADDFVGLFVQQASVTVNNLGTPDTTQDSVSIIATNILIGTGGVSGMVTLSDTGILYRDFGSFSAELDSFSITFRQGTIVYSAISGKLVLPSGFNDDGNPSTILIDATIKDNGDFSVTAKVTGVLPSFTLPNVFTMTLRSLTLGEQNGRFFITVAGTLDFIANIPGLGQVMPKGIIINKLIIWDDGEIEFEGGGLTVPKAFSFKVGPVKLEVSHLSFGSYNRTYNGIPREYFYFGFDGMVNTGAAGINAQGNGIKYYFTHDDNGTDKPFNDFLSIDGIGIDITVPGNVPPEDADFYLSGYLSMKNPDPSIPSSTAGTEYTGKVSFGIPALGMIGSAAMRLDPSVPAFVVDLGLELSVPLPLGSTGLGIYGFRGLIGQHYLPSKSATTPPLPDTATWWDYYKAKSVITHEEGIEIDKFADESGFSLGAGISIATDLGDAGFIFSSRLFLLLGIPDVFLIQGQATIISDRITLTGDNDPPFSALIVISEQSIEGNLSVNLNFPSILSIQAELDMAFFFNNASGWYLNIGKDTPASAQVQAKILTLFQGHAYLMISAQGIKTGAGISFTFNKSYGGVGLYLSASLDMGGSISFKPIQVGGFLTVAGEAKVKVFKVSISIYASLTLAVEAPNPFNLVGSFQVKVKVFFVHISVTVDVSWRFNSNTSVLLAPVPVLSLPDAATGYLPASAINILTGEIFPINYVTTESVSEGPANIPVPGDPRWMYNFTDATDVENVVIPLDSFVDILLLKPVLPGNVPVGGASNQLPTGYSELLPPKKGVAKQVKHQYEIKTLQIYAWGDTGAGNAWVPYNIYEAVTAIVDSNTGPDAIDLTTLKPGYWQFTTKDVFNKVRLMSQNMFSFMNGTNNISATLDANNYSSGDVFCYDNIIKSNVVNWKGVAQGTSYPAGSTAVAAALSMTFNGITGTVTQESSFGAPSLALTGAQGDLLISFPASTGSVELDFGDNQNALAVNFLQAVYTPGFYGKALQVYIPVSSYPVTADQQNAVISYNDLNNLIDAVDIVFQTATSPDYTGDIQFGGHFALDNQFIPSGLNANLELSRGLIFSSWYNQSVSTTEVLALDYSGNDALVAQWPLDSLTPATGGLGAIRSGNPESGPGFYQADGAGTEQLHNSFVYSSPADALIVPFNQLLKLENSSFAFEVTVIFDPFTAGIGTLLTKIAEAPSTGYKKGYALHLVQDTPGEIGAVYSNTAAIPQFKVLLTCYDGLSSSVIQATEQYTLDCASSELTAAQYKRILVSVNREAGDIELFINKVLCFSGAIPAELGVYAVAEISTYLNQITYITESIQARQADNDITPDGVVNEVQVLSDAMNKTVQPLWRPDTTFAIQVVTQDRVNSQVNPVPFTHVFGFRTAGPLGHFHQQSKVYLNLAAQDQASAFKLASLQFYIDMDRSFPDAQGRYNLSKPVLYHDPLVKLYFTQPYINAMYANWDGYQGMPAVQSSLQLQLLDPSGTAVTQQLVWAPVQQTTIDSSNYKTLPPDQQAVFLLNQAASGGGCNPMPDALTKNLTQGSYQFPDLQPNSLYTALFNAIYQPGISSSDTVEVYRYSFLTSRFATFQDQASGFILNDQAGAESYAIYTTNVSFTQDYIDQTLLLLINADPGDDPAAFLQYAIPYERLVYGGLQLPAPEQFNNTVIQLVINTDPDSGNRVLLGVLVYNPEAFNDPKLPAVSLDNTVQLTWTTADGTVLGPDQFINLYSGDTSAVLITNAAMNIPAGSLELYFRYKIFNGTDYETEFEDYTSPQVSTIPYFS